ncbi:MAG: penicillin-binding protein [Eggerthellaceae bacterium]|nr:penicillin-binding protein [Eggerthellaceae bacterium]
MKLRRKSRQSRSHALAWGALILIAALAFVTFRAVTSVYAVMNEWTEDLPTINSESFDFAEDSYMYASDGTTLLAKFQLEKRDPVDLAQVSPYVIKGTVDVEDVRFYEHNGVDIPGIIRALVNNLRGGPLEGASTITQQLVRNTALSEEAFDISLKRKVREAELALDLEKRYSKEQILNMYLNTINYGDGCYGIQAAAVNYFQVNASDLTLAQAATLVGIPQSPTAFNPKANPQECVERRNQVLERMLAAGDISQEEHDAAVAEELALNPAPAEPSQGIYAYPYFTSFVRDQLMSEDNKYNCSYADLFEGGLKIYTTLDVNMQNKAEQACWDQYDSMDEGMDAALVAIDPQTGYVKALVGGNDFYADQWNIAVQGGRPSGSTFKVFTLTAAIEQGISPRTALDCSNPVTLANGQTINNFGQADYGKRSLADATAISSNTGYYRLAERLGADAVIEMAHRMGIKSELSPYPIITLGTENVTPLEMAEAYSTLATGGIHRDYVIITRIENKNGDVLYEAPDTANRVLDEKVAGAVTEVLRGVFEKSYATAAGAGPWNGQPVAGKTGTGVDFRDHWLVGYCPQLCCAAWLGNRDYSSTSEYLTANSLWHDFMSMALEDYEIIDFPEVDEPEYTNEDEEMDDGDDEEEEDEEKSDESASKSAASPESEDSEAESDKDKEGEEGSESESGESTE